MPNGIPSRLISERRAGIQREIESERLRKEAKEKERRERERLEAQRREEERQEQLRQEARRREIETRRAELIQEIRRLQCRLSERRLILHCIAHRSVLSKGIRERKGCLRQRLGGEAYSFGQVRNSQST